MLLVQASVELEFEHHSLSLVCVYVPFLTWFQIIVTSKSVDSYISHVIFLMRFAHNQTCACLLHGSRRASQCVCVAYIQTIFMPSMMCV